MIVNIQEIQRILKDRRLSIVAKETGLHYNTLANIRDGKTTNPGIETLNKLSDYLNGGGNATV